MSKSAIGDVFICRVPWIAKDTHPKLGILKLPYNNEMHGNRSPPGTDWAHPEPHSSLLYIRI